jgi:hypothetical protein
MDNRRVFSNNVPISYAQYLERKKSGAQSYKTTKPGSLTITANTNIINKIYDTKYTMPPMIAMDGTNSFVFPYKTCNTKPRCYSSVGIFYPYGNYLTQFGIFNQQNMDSTSR